MRGQLLQTTDGRLLCDFPERLVLVANHQIYTDWLYLWWIGYAAGMHGRIYVVLKESLKRIPVIGWGMQFAQFIFLKRNWEQDKPQLAAHMQKFNRASDPMWLMMFPEGTNLADCTREVSKEWARKNGIKDMQHTLLPRSTGLHFMLQELRQTVDYVYDCTIAYEGVSRGQFAQDIFTVGASYFGGRPPKSVNMYWRRFRISNIPLDDPKKFELWLTARWREKDKFIEGYLRTGRFPADSGSTRDYTGKVVTGTGHIEAEIKPKYWYEFLQVFAPIGLFALVLYVFYGALPADIVNKIKTIDQKTIMKQIDDIQKGKIKMPQTKDIMAQAPKNLQNQIDAVRRLAAKKDTTPEKVIAQKSLPAAASGVTPVTTPEAATKSTPKSELKTPNAPKTLVKTSNAVNKAPAKEKPTTPAKTDLPKKQPQHTKPPMKTLKTTKATKPHVNYGKAKQDAKPSSKKPDVKPQSISTPAKTGLQQPDAKLKSKILPKKPVQSAASSVTSKKADAKMKVSTSTEKPTSKAETIVTTAKPEEKSVDNAEIRKARKKLELRQGKQEPKRKTRRALETAVATS